MVEPLSRSVMHRLSFAPQNRVWRIQHMSTVAEIREGAAKLPQVESAELAAFLLDSLEIEHHWVDDAVVERRSKEMSNEDFQGPSWKQV